jgi:ankyrin repeat protein
VGAVVVWVGNVLGAGEAIGKVFKGLLASERERALVELDARGIPPLPRSYLPAIEGNREDVVDLLLRAEVKAETPISRGWTPLHWAAFEGHTKLVRLILKRVPPSPKDPWGRTPLALAAGHGHLSVIEELVGKGADIQGQEGGGALYEAAAAGKAEAVERLLVLGASPDKAVGTGGWTALMAAVSNGDTLVTSMLLKAGASRDVVNAAGQTALLLAQQQANRPLIDLLRQ